MENKRNIIYGLQNSFCNPLILDHELTPDFLEWYSIEGSDRIGELSRQLRTFLNYKKSIIRFRFSESQKDDNFLRIDSVIKWKSDLFSLISEYITLLEKIGVKEGILGEKIQSLLDKVKVHPNNLELKFLKQLKILGKKIWKKIHILSEFELYNYHFLLYRAIKIICILCRVEGIFFPIFSNFYSELKQNYLQLEKELTGLIYLNKIDQFEVNKKEGRLGILE